MPTAIPHTWNGRTYFFTSDAADAARRLVRAHHALHAALTASYAPEQPGRFDPHAALTTQAQLVRNLLCDRLIIATSGATWLGRADGAPHLFSTTAPHSEALELAQDFTTAHPRLTGPVEPGDVVATPLGPHAVVVRERDRRVQVRYLGLPPGRMTFPHDGLAHLFLHPCATPCPGQSTRGHTHL